MYSEDHQKKRIFGSDTTMGLFVGLYLILLAFFIMLNAVSEQAADRAQLAIDSVNSTFKEAKALENQLTIDPAAQNIAAKDQVLSIISQAFLAKMQLSGRFSSDGGSVFEVQFSADKLFQPGSFRLRRDMLPFLDQLVAAVKSGPKDKRQQIALMFGVGVRPVDKEMTRSQEAAIRRAETVALYLGSQGIPNGLFVTGFVAIPEGEVLAAFRSADLLGAQNGSIS
ncbi:MAG: hypothetical protein JKY60_10550 [Kordiimonadaceae bacterium]|nr:hypothetical protein [Kordiimonadaceae bacterium]